MKGPGDEDKDGDGVDFFLSLLSRVSFSLSPKFNLSPLEMLFRGEFNVPASIRQEEAWNDLSIRLDHLPCLSIPKMKTFT